MRPPLGISRRAAMLLGPLCPSALCATGQAAVLHLDLLVKPRPCRIAQARLCAMSGVGKGHRRGGRTHTDLGCDRRSVTSAA